MPSKRKWWCPSHNTHTHTQKSLIPRQYDKKRAVREVSKYACIFNSSLPRAPRRAAAQNYNNSAAKDTLWLDGCNWAKIQRVPWKSARTKGQRIMSAKVTKCLLLKKCTRKWVQKAQVMHLKKVQSNWFIGKKTFQNSHTTRARHHLSWS